MAKFSDSPDSVNRLNEGTGSDIDCRQLEQSAPKQDVIKPQENWFLRWWNEGLEKRSSPRESVPWIAAYFFSGGPPKARKIRNVSPGGAFVDTEERWYRGTIVRMTISDRRELVGPKSITVNAMVGRSTSDGLAFQFIFMEEKKRGRGGPTPYSGLLVNVTRTQFADFLSSVRT